MIVRSSTGQREPVVDRVQQALDRALAVQASDLHLEPTAAGYELRLRVDGLLEVVERLDRETGRAMVSRLMVLAQLLTYRLDVPQEGRLNFVPGTPSTASGPDAMKSPDDQSTSLQDSDRPLELRLAVMPTTHGLRAAVRLPAELHQPRRLDQLGLPDTVLAGLQQFARAEDGMLLLTGPAGSGKTTTIYALLEHIVAEQPGLSIVALEDPVERDLPGVTQIEVRPFGELTYERALRSMLRQDPQVLMIGEIRDSATARLALQVALSGHRLISTLHAGDPAAALARLLEMGIEPYQLTGSLFGVVSQRLLRRRDQSVEASKDRPCYRGRVPVASFAAMARALHHAIKEGGDIERLRAALAEQPGYQTLRQAVEELINAGQTDRAEIDRVLSPAAATNGPVGD